MVAHYSTTRRTHSGAGYASEAEFLAAMKANIKLAFAHQDEVLEQNARSTLKCLQEAFRMDVDYFVADRSFFDYSGYYFEVFKEHLTLDVIDKKREHVHGFMRQLHAMSLDSPAHVVYLPYPAHWSKDVESSDGYRADKTGKNMTWNAHVTNELHDYARIAPDNKGQGLYFLHRLTDFMEKGSARDRALGILSAVSQFR